MAYKMFPTKKIIGLVILMTGCANPLKKTTTQDSHQSLYSRCSGTFQKQQRHGLWVCRYANGQISAKIQIVKGLYHGPLTEFDEQGRKIRLTEFRQGRQQGWQIVYNPQGKVIEKCHYRNDKRAGLCQTWYSDGGLEAKARYDKGYLNGSYVDYYPNRKVRSRGTFLHNTKVPSWAYYNSKGRPSDQALYPLLLD